MPAPLATMTLPSAVMGAAKNPPLPNSLVTRPSCPRLISPVSIDGDHAPPGRFAMTRSCHSAMPRVARHATLVLHARIGDPTNWLLVERRSIL
jgi:hypothetical protein